MKAALALVAIALAGVGALFHFGVYDISATNPHLAPTHWLLDAGMRRSVKRHAAHIAVPDVDHTPIRGRGLALFRRHCVQCHGAPGVAPDAFALGMSPVASNLALTARDWPANEIFWVVKEGIKMTGMPAWKHRLADDDLWAIVAFVRELPALSPVAYRALASATLAEAADPSSPTLGDPERGRQAIHQYACSTCHRIPGIVGANAPVGPPLDAMATRGLIAGAYPNTTDNMVRWLRSPQSLSPASAMPDLGVSDRDARDIAAYLAALR